MNRKSPFKMWGSYLGAILSGIGVYYWMAKEGEYAIGGLVVLASIPLGFLLGWGIEYLLRKNKII